MLKNVEWGEFRLGDLFEVCSSNRIFHANTIEIYDKQVNNSYPYVVRSTLNNGVRGFILQDTCYLNPSNTLSFAQDTFSVFYQKQPYFTGNKVKILKPLFNKISSKIMIFITTYLQKKLEKYSWGIGSTIGMIENESIKLPIKNNKLDFDFMEKFISMIEQEKLVSLEQEKLVNLNAYLKVTGLNDFELTQEEELALSSLDDFNWEEFNLESLFGKSIRGKRLKSSDRIIGTLPFVTAGEHNDGISAFIKNDVEIFSKNTITIDMFGSAKYRNYEYGADDHISIVDTKEIPKLASIFVTTSIHKSSYTGKFNYGKNFYPKDADILSINLPIIDNQPDYNYMETLISAVQKLVIKDVVLYTDKNICATKKVIDNN